MELLGYPIETLYLTTLIVSGALTILYLFFGDLAEAALDFMNPALILAFLTFLSATGYLLEYLTNWSSLIILILSSVAALLLDSLLHMFVLVPLSSAEESIAYTSHSLKGRVGTIIIPIPKDGFGEVILKGTSGAVSKPAASFEQEEIEEGAKVLIIEVKNGVAYVARYDQTERLFFPKER